MKRIAVAVGLCAVCLGTSLTTGVDAVGAATMKNKSSPTLKATHATIVGPVAGLKGDLVQYSNDLFRGGDILGADGILDLKKRGIVSVVSVTPNPDIATLCSTYGLHQAVLPIEYGVLTDAEISVMASIIDTLPRPVYIHCHGGKRRAGLLCALWRVDASKWGIDAAWREYRDLGGDAADSLLFKTASAQMMK